jgi:hypothetical protein
LGRGLLLRFPLQGFFGKQLRQLRQRNRLFGSVNYGFQLCFQAHSRTGTILYGTGCDASSAPSLKPTRFEGSKKAPGDAGRL